MSKTYPADPRCQGCYYIEKVKKQAIAICTSQNANVLYKTRLKALEARVEELKAENKRLFKDNVRHYKLYRENVILKQQIKKLSTELAEAYDAVGILNKKVMDSE